ncbi:MAG: hypothetical protein K2G63_01030 [Oscillospiraceae bacterium]|nr:hypothetical protein [Oscillospiraceae bacterium]
MNIKKITAVLASLIVLLSAAACQEEKNSESMSKPESSVSDNSEPEVKKEVVRLKNFMTETERSRVKVGNLTLLDEDKNQQENTGKVQVYIGTADDLREETERLKDFYDSPEEYEEQIRGIDELDSDFRYIHTALVDGRYICNFHPPYDYNGGEIGFSISKDNETWENVTLHNFDEVKNYIKDSIAKNAEFYNDEIFDVEQEYEDTIALWQSVIDGTYEEIAKEEAEKLKEASLVPISFNGNYKDVWEYNRDEVEEIKDSVKEISIYDEELDTEFLVHVTLPPDFDESKTYPMFVFSDGVWRFGNCPSLRKLMENDEIQDVILVTIGYNYKFDGTSVVVRAKYFYEEREKTLNFINDNLTPYLSELYNIDFEHSGFYGHSAGGVMSHYAVFNSDKYENQPFKYYIIGSPALWELHRLDNEKYPDANINDYGYWDRNDTLDKFIFLCGGENEDPEYEEYYDGYDTTLEGIAHLKERLDNHGVENKCKIYENSGHWQFIPDMFEEFFREFYKI